MSICSKNKSRHPHIEKHAYFACFSLPYRPAFYVYQRIKATVLSQRLSFQKRIVCAGLDYVFRIEVEKALYVVCHNNEGVALGSGVLIITAFERTFRLAHCNGKCSDVG